jgi:V/A-type H+-transporting ATPase subunit K
MMILAVIVLTGILFLMTSRALTARSRLRMIAGGLVLVNALVALFMMGLVISFWLNGPTPVQAAQQPALQSQPPAPAGVSGSVAIGASLAAGLAAIGAGIAVGIASAAAIGAIAEKPEILGRTLIFVGLAEGIAIYGLIVAFMLLTGGLGGG